MIQWNTIHRNENTDSDANDDNNLESKNDEETLSCDWTGCLGDYENGSHVCDFDIVICHDCKSRVIRKDLLNEHTQIWCEKCQSPHAKCIEHSCPMDIIKCKCGISVLRKLHKQHLDFRCQEHNIACKYADFGCNKILKRKDVARHERVKMAEHLRMVKRKCVSLALTVESNKLHMSTLELRLNMLERR